MRIRPGNLADAEDIHKINEKELGYEIAYSDFERTLESILTENWQKIFVAEVEGEFAGYVQISEYVSLLLGKYTDIMSLAVYDKFKGQGIAQKLMEEAEDWAKRIGARGVRLNSGSERKESNIFYEKIGYKKIKSQINFKKTF